METASLTYRPGQGWSAPFPAWDGPGTMAVVFGARALGEEPEPWRALDAALGGSFRLGCSTSGEIDGTRVADGSLVCAVVRFQRTGLALARAAVGPGETSRGAGAALAQALGGEQARGLFVLSDGLAVNGTQLAAGLLESLPAGVPAVGGLAGDGTAFARTWVVAAAPGEATVPRSGEAAALALRGPAVRLAFGSRGGWDTFGVERVVTRSSANVVQEIDGRPALELYKTYLGDRAAELPSSALLFPLGLRQEGELLVRTILRVDEASQSLTFAGDVPQGSRVRLMRCNLDRLIEGAAEAGQLVRGEAGATLCLAVSCVGRRLVLGERAEEELEAVRESLPPDAVQAGFYSYGELGRMASGHCALHNQTMTVTAIQEA